MSIRYPVCPLASHVDRRLTFEASLASQVAVPRMRAFLNQHPARNPREFLLRLSIGFGEPWTFRAVEIWPQSHELSQMSVFRRGSVPGQHGLSPIQLTNNPPVVPLWVDPLLMGINIDCWLERMIGDSQAGWQSRPGRTGSDRRRSRQALLWPGPRLEYPAFSHLGHGSRGRGAAR